MQQQLISIGPLGSQLGIAGAPHRPKMNGPGEVGSSHGVARRVPRGACQRTGQNGAAKHHNGSHDEAKDSPSRPEEQDAKGRDVELRYFRDTDRREVDFVIVEGRAPELMVECKWADAEVDRGLKYLKARFPKCEAWQVSAVGTKDYVTPEGIRVASAMRLLRRLV